LIWLDKVSLYEINDAGLSRDLRSRCFYNTNTSDQVFGLGSDTWRQVDGTRGIRWNITLPPFLSQVLIKDSIGVVNRVIEPLKLLLMDKMCFVSQTGPGIIRIRLHLTKRENVTLDILNLRGQIVFSRKIKMMNSGWHDEIISCSGRIARGLYVVQVHGPQLLLKQRVMLFN
jgi:hypothetical protein